MLTLRWNPLQVDVNAYVAHLGAGMQDSTYEVLFQRAFMHANQAYLDSNGFLARVLFHHVSIASFKFTVRGSNSSQLHRHRYSQETFVSLYSVLCFSIKRPCLHMYFYSSFQSNLARSHNPQRAPRLLSTEGEFEFLDVASTRSVSQCTSLDSTASCRSETAFFRSSHLSQVMVC